MNQKSKILLSVAAASLVLTGCGSSGSSSSSDNSDTGNTDGNTSSVVISGKAVDGYIRNGLVCFDINNNNECDDNEPFSKTKSDGTYSLDLSSLTDNERDTGKILISGGVDDTTGRPFTGILKAPLFAGETTINVTPLSTIVAAKVTNNSEANTKLDEVATSLNIASSDIKEDPLTLQDKTVYETGLKIQKAIEILKEAVKTDSSLSEEANKFDQIAKVIANTLDGQSQTTVENVITNIDFSNEEGLENAEAIKSATTNIVNQIDITTDESKLSEISNMVETLKETIVQEVETAKTNNTFDENYVVTTDVDNLVTNFDSSMEIIKRLFSLLEIENQDIFDSFNQELSINNSLKDSITYEISMDDLKSLIVNANFEEPELQKYLLSEIEQFMIKEASINNSDQVAEAIVPGLKMYQFDIENEELNGQPTFAIGVEEISLTNNSIDFIEKLYDPTDGSFVKAPDNSEEYESSLKLTNGQWVVDTYTDETMESHPITYNTDGSINLTVDGFKEQAKLVYTEDISGQSINISNDGYGLPVTFPDGSKRYVIDVTMEKSDEYRLFNEIKDYSDYQNNPEGDSYISLSQYFEKVSLNSPSNSHDSVLWENEYVEGQWTRFLLSGNLSDGTGEIVKRVFQNYNYLGSQPNLLKGLFGENIPTNEDIVLKMVSPNADETTYTINLTSTTNTEADVEETIGTISLVKIDKDGNEILNLTGDVKSITPSSFGEMQSISYSLTDSNQESYSVYLEYHRTLKDGTTIISNNISNITNMDGYNHNDLAIGTVSKKGTVTLDEIKSKLALDGGLESISTNSSYIMDLQYSPEMIKDVVVGKWDRKTIGGADSIFLTGYQVDKVVSEWEDDEEDIFLVKELMISEYNNKVYQGSHFVMAAQTQQEILYNQAGISAILANLNQKLVDDGVTVLDPSDIPTDSSSEETSTGEIPPL